MAWFRPAQDSAGHQIGPIVVEPAQDLLVSLCADLRLLWTQAGGPSLRVLSSRLRLSKSQLGAILGGRVRRPPEWTVVRGLVDSFHTYAVGHARSDQVSLRTGVDEYWRPRYAALEYAFSQRRGPHPGHSAPTGVPAGVGDPRAFPPAQLPTAVAGFTGRVAALDRMDALLRADVRPAVLITAIGGTAGVGKTALAVYWAHRVRDRFPDGQLYVNLRGFHPTGAAVAPGEAIREFLDALGVPAQRIPTGLAAQAALYRSVLAGKRVLVVLDNACDTEQVRPLLPGTPGCVVVVTSRNRLTGLVAGEAAHSVVLDLLSIEEARQLVARRLGADRVAAEPEAANRLIDACARLPLALAVATAHAAAHPGFRLAALADALTRTPGVLDAFPAGDPASDVRNVFSWSYRALSQEAAGLFRLLGLHPGPDIAAPAVASLAGIPVSQARTPLADLTSAHLLTEHIPGRYIFHDLLRAYATELVHGHEPTNLRQTANIRMFDHYLHTSHAAAVLIAPHREPITPAPAMPAVVCTELTSFEEAQAWFTAERPVLLAIITLAACTGHDTHAWQLAWTLDTYLNRRGHLTDLAAVQRIALDAGQRLGDRNAQAHAHLSLGLIEIERYHLDSAHAHFLTADDLFEAVGNHNQQARIHLNLGLVRARQGHLGDALKHAHRAMELFQVAGNRVGQARALNSIGWYHVQLGDHEQALIHCERAFQEAAKLEDRYGQAASSDSCGHAYHHLGQYEQAAAWYGNSVDLFRDLGDHYNEATALTHLGDTHLAAGESDAARDSWRQALDILDELGHVDAEAVRAKLR